ncbi:hypothetical protein BSKO_05428 [Bryopsis sp. KO-2023]|nr:hypothetical protein BSKO_05428 [Bryopsis sp. KO-2023]
MGRTTLPLLVLGLSIVLAIASEDPKETLPGVEDLSLKNFDSFVNGQKHALVEFYAPWCGHCKRLTPELKKLGAAISADPKLKNRVVIAKVDADQHRALGERFGVTGFPTLKWFPRGKPIDEPESYEGARSSDAFMRFIEKKLKADQGYARHKDVDPFAKKYLAAEDPAAKAKVIVELKDFLKALPEEDQKIGDIYVKLMSKASEKGDDAYLGKEQARVSKMLESGNINQEKVVQFEQKLSVLSAFLEVE